MLSLNPPIVTAYPGDVVNLSVAANYPPPLYVTDGSAALLNSDYSLTVNNTTFEGYRGALQLRSKNGWVKWTLTSQCLPGASESIGFLIGVDGTGNNILDIRFSSTQYKIYDSSGVLSTVSYTAVSGDVIKLALDGPVLRAYINDILIYTKTYTSTNPYPARYVPTTFAALATSVSGYKIPAPELAGDWQCTEDYVDWNVPSTLASSFTTTDDERTAVLTITGGPGTYTVTGLVGVATALATGSTSTASDTVYAGVPFSVNETVQFGTTPGGTLPGGLSPDTTYYVKTYSAGSISVSLTQGGATVNITSNGTGAWVARIGEIALQSGTGLVVIPAFDVIGIPVTNNVEMAGGTTARFATTYDSAQQANNGTYITRTVVTGGGGSFDNSGLYTAPTTAGVYTLRFESNNQRRDFTVTVPTTLTPEYSFASPSEALTFTTNMTGTKTWSVVGGSLNTTSGATVIWTLPSVIGQKCRISVTNGTLTRTRDVEVLEKFPYAPDLEVPLTRKKTVLISRAEDRTRTSRVKDVDSVGWDNLELRFTDRELAELTAAKAFWDEYHPQGRFFYEDVSETRRLAVYFDSDLGYTQNLDGAFDYAFRLIEA